jgi:spermidine synthase
VVTSIAIALTGLASMGMEILWFRQLGAMLRSQRNVFSLLLAIILVGTAVGSALVSRIQRRFRTDHAFAFAATIYVVAALLGVATLENHDLVDIDRLFRGHSRLSPLGWKLQEFSSIMTPYLQVVLVPVIAMGTTYPLANAYVQRRAGEVARRAGYLYLANTLGAVAGASLAGFVLLPVFGVQHGAAILMACMAASVVALLTIAEQKRSLWCCLAVTGLCLAAYLALPADHMARRLVPDRFSKYRVIALQEGASESIAVLEGAGGIRRLVTNGFSMSGTSNDAQRYMRLFVHLPLLQMNAPERVLVVAFGVGNTAQAALHHPVQSIDVVDLSEDILNVSHLFSATNGNVLRDPRVHVFVNDGRQHLRMTPPAIYDLITSEPPPLMNAGTGALYSVEYYQLARSRLKAGGWMTQWLPIYQLDEKVALSVVRSFIDVFPASILLSGWNNELVLAGINAERMEIDPDLMTRLLEARPRVSADLSRVMFGSAAEIIGSVVGTTTVLHQATRTAAPVTDDWPVMEYESILFAPIQRTPDVYAPLGLKENCPKCFEGDVVRPDLELLYAYMLVHDAYLASSTYLEPFAPRARQRPFVRPQSEIVDRALLQSEYLRRIVR